MAAARSHQVLKQTIRLFSPRGVEGLSTRSSSEEFEESDVWNCQPDSRKPATSMPQPTYRKSEAASPSSASMPMHVPDWSRMHEYKKCTSTVLEDDDEEVEEEGMQGVRLPPHEIVMRRRVASSSSVIEGVGRTLKGRDLSRVRNAIWAQTGFQD